MRDLITTAFEVVGILLLIAGISLAVVERAGLPLGLGIGGALLLVASSIIVKAAPAKRRVEEDAL